MIGYIQIKGKPDRHKQSGKEIFTSCFDDEAVMMDFYLKMSA